MPKVAKQRFTDGRFTHACYSVMRTLAFPPGARGLAGLRRQYTNVLIDAVAGLGLPQVFASAGIKRAQGAVSDLLWAERQLRYNTKLRDDSGKDLDPSNTTTQWVLEWRRRREADLVQALRELGLDKSEGQLDIGAILADVHRDQTHLGAQDAVPIDRVLQGDPVATQSNPIAPGGDSGDDSDREDST